MSVSSDQQWITVLHLLHSVSSFPQINAKNLSKSRVFRESYDSFKWFVHSFETARFILHDTTTGSFQLPYMSARRVPDKAGSTAKLKVGNCPFERGDAEIIRNVSRSILES